MIDTLYVKPDPYQNYRLAVRRPDSDYANVGKVDSETAAVPPMHKE